MQDEFLDQKRHAAEGTLRQPAPNLGPCLVGQHLEDSVELRVDLFNSLDGSGHQFFGADFFARNQLGQPQAVILCIFTQGQHRYTLLR